MSVLDRIRARPAASAAAGALLGILVGLARAPVEIDVEAPPAPEWRLPDAGVVARGGSGRFERVRTAAVWGETEARGGGRGRAGTAAPQTSRWRLLGVIDRPQTAALILNESDGTVTRLAPGETLPDGARLRAIDGNLIRFEREGCRYERRLYAADAASAAADCGEPSGTDDPASTLPDTDR